MEMQGGCHRPEPAGQRVAVARQSRAVGTRGEIPVPPEMKSPGKLPTDAWEAASLNFLKKHRGIDSKMDRSW